MEEFLCRPSEPHLVEPVSGSNGCHGFVHAFCGEHKVPGAMCPNCRKPMLRFITLDAADPRLELGQVVFPTLSLVFCWTCNLAQDRFYYRVREDGGVGLMYYGKGGVQKDFPYEDYPVFFPARYVVLRSPTPEEREAMAAINGSDSKAQYEAEHKWPALGKTRHQVGGEPYFLGNEIGMVCPECGDEMPFLASIGDDSGTPKGFVDNAFVQVLYHYCRACWVVGAYQEID